LASRRWGSDLLAGQARCSTLLATGNTGADMREDLNVDSLT
jgi:hypothetical protein